jgi:hypothetical protein
MPLNPKFNKLINDVDVQNAFKAAVQARDAYWDTLRELENLTECDVEPEMFQHFDEEDILYFLTELEEQQSENS